MMKVTLSRIFAILFLGFLLCLLLVGRISADPSVPSPEKLTGQQYINSLTPIPGVGPGVFIGEPVPVNADEHATDFGAGCSVWLQYALGSQGQMGAQHKKKSKRSCGGWFIGTKCGLSLTKSRSLLEIWE